MPFSSATTQKAELSAAIEELIEKVDPDLREQSDLAVVFFTPDHARHAESLLRSLKKDFGPKHILGCVAESVAGTGVEIEEAPAISLWLARWEAKRHVSLETFELHDEKTSEGRNLLGWPDGLIEYDPADSVLLVLGDPHTLPVDRLLQGVNENYPGLKLVGGMASGTRGPGSCRLISDRGLFRSGAVGVMLRGEIGLTTIVSQGCRPVGKPMVITKAEGNVIQELGGRKPLSKLQEMWRELPTSEQRLFEKGLHLGLVINEYQGEFQQGDFLVRNCGLVQGVGALVVGDQVRAGQTVQFQVRDAASADVELRDLLRNLESGKKPPLGAALLFTCNGRGTKLFSEPAHDARAVESVLGKLPLGGFFAQGELGPVGGRNHIHGFTASLAFFEQ